MNAVPSSAGLAKSGGGTEWPPSWETKAHGISSGRYIDPAFQKLEYEKLWSRVWQAAARVDEIPEVNDYTTYDIGDQSAMLVRVDPDTIKAYHNVCPHRGTSLTEGCGAFKYGKIICPFHGWRWDTQGRNIYVLEREEFRDGKLQDSDVALKELKSVVFAGFVFISFDKNPQPFDEFIAPVRHLLENLAIGDMRNYWWKSIPIVANWKVAQEAFFEGYHVPATHPQLEKAAASYIYSERMEGEVLYSHRFVAYDAFPQGHGRFYAGSNTPHQGGTKVLAKGVDPVVGMAERLGLLVTGMDAQVLQGDIDILLTLKGKPIPEGSNAGAEFMKALYSHAAAVQRPMPKPDAETMGQWGGEIFVFPNLMILPFAGNAMIYRVRPDRLDPDRCIFEIMSTTTYPAAEKRPRATLEHVTDNLDPKQVLLIPRQDLANIPRMQKGMHSRGMRQTWLAKEQEKIILNMHQELDRYLRS
jgi:phenylpropionate dioxygenase-like ring-hydroxylating dioxygenase large terminal subunit